MILLIIEANLGGEGVFNLNEDISTSSEEKHDCTACVDGDIYGKFDLTVKGELLKNEKWSLEFKIAEIKVKFCDAYWSFTYGEGAFTSCPHISYKLNVIVSDTSGNALEGAKVLLNGKTYSTSKNGIVETFLPNGTYNVSVNKENYSSKEQMVYIKSDSKSLNIKLDDISWITPQTLSLGVGTSAAVTKTGDLYTIGYD